MRLRTKSRDPKGQTLVIVAVGMVVLVGMVGLVIDVGMQWGDNRGSQNASDASAEAGAVVLMEYMLGATHDDADVLDAVEDAACSRRDRRRAGGIHGLAGSAVRSVDRGWKRWCRSRPGRRASESSERASTRPCSLGCWA